MGNKSEIIVKASDYIFNLFKERLSEKFVYHNFHHTREVVNYAEKIAGPYQLDEEDYEDLLLAAWFHDAGYVETYNGHEEKSVDIFNDFLERNTLSPARKKKVETLILSTKHEHAPTTLLEEILHDADIVNVGTESFFEKAELLRVEWECFLGKAFSNVEWAEIQVKFLVNTNFYTQEAIKTYGPRRDINIQEQSRQLKKSQDKGKGNGKPGRGIETMYRTAYRNHINLSSIADAKANMMISINTIILSVIIALVGSGFTFTGRSFVENIRFTVPILVLLLGALLSVVFAILSARPEVTSKTVNREKIKEKRSSVLFFGNFANMALSDFLESLKEFRGNQELLYDNMTVDLYYLGIVLTRKYKLLRYAYNTFMAALVLAVLTFITIFTYTANTV